MLGKNTLLVMLAAIISTSGTAAAQTAKKAVTKLAANPTAPSTSTKVYRYSLETKSGEYTYAGEPLPLLRGNAVRVKRDSLSRVIETWSLKNGKTGSHYVYHYLGKESLPTSYDYYSKDTLIFKITILRDANGNRVREDYYLPSGKMSSYYTRTVSGNTVESVSHFDTTGSFFTIQTRSVSYFSPNGLCIREESHVGAMATFDFEKDEKTGLAQSRKDYSYSKYTGYTKYTYDNEGLLIREESFDETGKANGVTQYKNDLKIDERRTFKDGRTFKKLYTYMPSDLVKTMQYYKNDKLVYTFIYEYLNGKIKRTIARGADGTLWAEYPKMLVEEIGTDGRPLDDYDENSIIYKKGDWW